MPQIKRPAQTKTKLSAGRRLPLPSDRRPYLGIVETNHDALKPRVRIDVPQVVNTRP